VPRTESPKKRSVPFCGDCGYELARDNDGTCPMCRRFEQLRLDFIVPRPSDFAAHRPGSRNTGVSGVPDEWLPTVAEYRAILAERRLRSDSPGQHAATVIRTAAMRQTQVSPPPRGATAPGDGALTSPAKPKPPAKDQASPSPQKAGARRGQDKSRRAARARFRSSGALETTTPPATVSSSAPVELGDVPATPSSSTPPKAVGALSVTAAATGSEMLAMPRQGARPLMQAGPVRHRALRSRTVVPLRSVITVAIVVASALIGVAVSILLLLPSPAI
jgi:hypothetical protein